MTELYVLETNPAGHRPEYVAHLCEAWFQHKARPATIMANELVATALRSHLETPEATPLLEIIDDDMRTVLPRIRELVGDGMHVVVPSGDKLASDLVTRRLRAAHGGTLTLLLMRPPTYLGQGVNGVLRAAGKTAALLFLRSRPGLRVRALSGLTRRSKALVPGVRDPWTVGAGPVVPFEFDRTGNRKWFGIFGGINHRKSPMLVKAALSQLADQTGQAIGLLTAGMHDPVLLEQLESGPQSELLTTKSIDRRLTTEEIDSAIEAVDVVVVAHDHEGSSGIFIRAVGARSNVLAAGARSLRQDCSHGRHLVWGELTIDGLAAAASQHLGAATTDDLDRVPRPASPADFAADLLGDVLVSSS